MELSHLHERLAVASQLDRSGNALQAELLYATIVAETPDNVEAVSRLAHLSMVRGDAPNAVRLLKTIFDRGTAPSQVGVDLAIAHLNASQTVEASEILETVVGTDSACLHAWLLLGEIRDSSGDSSGALKAWYQAVIRAQRAGQWHDEESTPTQLLPFVVKAIERVRQGHRELFFGTLDKLRREHGNLALRRVERALTGFLREWNPALSSPHQRARFLFIPDLPNTGYYDPYLQPWAKELQASFCTIRDEAVAIVRKEAALSNFVDIKEGDFIENYVGGKGLAPAWEAFFFYRHGQRFERNHTLCPATGAILESLDLCRVAEHAPEICFSVMRPGTHILPHYGVTNSRLVMHLPLVVPSNCALNLFGVGEHH